MGAEAAPPINHGPKIEKLHIQLHRQASSLEWDSKAPPAAIEHWVMVPVVFHDTGKYGEYAQLIPSYRICLPGCRAKAKPAVLGSSSSQLMSSMSTGDSGA